YQDGIRLEARRCVAAGADVQLDGAIAEASDLQAEPDPLAAHDRGMQPQRQLTGRNADAALEVQLGKRQRQALREPLLHDLVDQLEIAVWLQQAALPALAAPYPCLDAETRPACLLVLPAGLRRPLGKIPERP